MFWQECKEVGGPSYPRLTDSLLWLLARVALLRTISANQYIYLPIVSAESITKLLIFPLIYYVPPDGRHDNLIYFASS